MDSFKELSKTYQYLRSIRKLLKRSKLTKTHKSWHILQEQLTTILTKKQIITSLDNKIITHSLETVGLGMNTTYQEKKNVLNIPNNKKEPIQIVKQAQNYLLQGGKNTRATNWQYRLQVAITEALSKGWYPLFGTYTVDPKTLPKGCLDRNDLWKKTDAWDKFVKHFKTEIADSLGYGRKPSKYPKTNTFFQYFAVIEHGKSGEHPHIHVIWLCKNIPKSWKTDPNNNCTNRTNTDIIPASSLWKHGIQRKTMALYITQSPFITKLKWVIPIDATGKPQKIGDAGAVAGYIGKYLTKGETKKWNHRVKCTRNLGIIQLVNQLTYRTSLKMLSMLSVRPQKYNQAQMMQSSTQIPLSLLREKSRKAWMLRLHTIKTKWAKRSLLKEWTKKPNEFYMSLISAVKAGMTPWTMNSVARYNAYTQILGVQEYTVVSNTQIKQMVHWLKKTIPKVTTCTTFTLLKGN